jgi:hypothetical protein
MYSIEERFVAIDEGHHQHVAAEFLDKVRQKKHSEVLVIKVSDVAEILGVPLSSIRK